MDASLSLPVFNLPSCYIAPNKELQRQMGNYYGGCSLRELKQRDTRVRLDRKVGDLRLEVVIRQALQLDLDENDKNLLMQAWEARNERVVALLIRYIAERCDYLEEFDCQ